MNNKILQDNKLELAKLIVSVPESRLSIICNLFPEYFVPPGSLEYMSDINTSYRKWIEDCDITREWLGDFPTSDIYNHYLKFCVEYRLSSMSKKHFYQTLENDFCMTV